MTAVTAHAVRHVEKCMGTVFSIDVRAPGVDPDAVRDAVEWLHYADATFSTYRADSEISRLRRGEMSPGQCSDDVRHVLERCAELTAETGGYFDCFLPGGLDPSGYVKGWAIERVSDLLEAAGSVNHCVNGGGDVQCVGRPEPGREWAVGIADPHRAGALLATVSGQRLAVATSGTAERGRHVVDPHSGERPDALASVTVVGERISEVDAYATAAFAMGSMGAYWLRGRGLRGLLVDGDGRRTLVEPAADG